jgi:hypothetical protein
MIAVGFLRWFCNLQREEIQLLLAARGIQISTGEISNLSEEFLLRFYVLHRRHVPTLKTVFERRNGMVLHLDGTGETGDDIVFSAKDGITGVTIDAQIMSSESKKYLTPFLERLRGSVGTPIVVVRDMSSQIRDAVSEVFPDVLQLICHYHFVKNLGKILFNEQYETLRKFVVDTNILGQLVALKEKVSKGEDGDVSLGILVTVECTWVALAVEYLLWPREIASGYPFVLPYFEVMNRAVEISGWVKRIIRWNAGHNLAVHAVLELSEKMDQLKKTKQVMQQYYQVRRIYGWFEEVRKILDVRRHLSGNEQQTSTPVNVEEVKETLKTILDRIVREGTELDGGFHTAAKNIAGQFQNHWDELLAEVYDRKGNHVEIVRHNGIEERSHRWSRMHTRRRTGRSGTTNDMAKYGALLAVLSNLENKTYVDEVLLDVKDFVYEMQNITSEEINDAKKLMKIHARKQIVRSDKTRVSLLREFVDLLECSEEQNDRALEGWLCKLKKSNP